MHFSNEMLSLLSVLALAGEDAAHAPQLPAVELPALATCAPADGREADRARARAIDDVREATLLRVATAIDAVRLLLARLDAERAADQARQAAQVIQNQSRGGSGG